MATYVIGDIHACYNEFMKLLEEIKFDETMDELILTGDLIGRGPLPVETMREVMRLKQQKLCFSVLGNHDLNFLAVHYGFRESRPKDNLDAILNSNLREEIVDCFEHTPLLFMHEKKRLIVAHAGIYPLWDIKRAKKESKEVSKVIQDKIRRKVLLMNMYSEQPYIYSSENKGLVRWRFAVNTFTRMRLCYKGGVLDYSNSAVNPDLVSNEGLVPWFKLCKTPIYKDKTYTLAFGHWAALNARCDVPNIKALDTGCVWGDRLTAWCFDNDKFTSVKSLGYAEIKGI